MFASRYVARRPLPSALKLLSTAVHKLTVTDTTIAEFGSALAFFAMAGLMLDPFPTLDAPGVNIPIFQMLLAITSEAGWGVLFFCVAIIQTAANLTKHLVWRKHAAFISAVVWLLLAILGASTRPASFFLAVCGAKCAVQCVVYLRLGIIKACDDCERREFQRG